MLENCYLIEEMAFTEQLLGQLLFTEENLYIEITKEDLYSANGIEIIIPALDFETLPLGVYIEDEQTATYYFDENEVEDYATENAEDTKETDYMENPTEWNKHNFRVVEDIQISGEIGSISQESAIRSSLGLKWK